MKKLRHFRLSFIVLALSLGLIAKGYFDNSKLEPAVSLPLDLRQGVTNSINFTAKLSHDYSIELEAAGNRGKSNLDCLMGMSTKPDLCAISSPLNLKWQLYKDDVVVAEGGQKESRTSMWAANKVARNLGTVSLEKAGSYKLKVHSLTDASSLEEFKPKVYLMYPALDAKGEGIVAALLVLGGMALGVIGIVFFIAQLITFCRPKKNF